MNENKSMCGISDKYPPHEIRHLINHRGSEYDQMMNYIVTKLYICEELRGRIYAYLKVENRWVDYLDDLWSESVMLLADRLLRGLHDGKGQVEPLLWRIFVNRWKTLSKRLGRKRGIEYLRHISIDEVEAYDDGPLKRALSVLNPREIDIFKRRSLRQKDHEIAEDLGLRTAEVRKIVYRARKKITNSLGK